MRIAKQSLLVQYINKHYFQFFAMKQNPELESLELLAKIILTAARTAPKGKGIDDIITCLLSQEEKSELADRMEELSEIKGIKFLLRDAKNVRDADAIVLIPSWSSKPSRPASATAWSTSRPDRSSFSIGHQRAISVISAVVSGTASAPSRLADLRLGRLEVLAPDGPDVDLERRTARRRRSAASRRRSTPTLTVTPGQRPFSAWRRADEVGRREDRAAALLGLDAGVGGPAVDGDPGVEDPLPRRDDVAVRPGALEDEATSASAASSRMCGVERRRADLLVGVGDERQALERQRAGRRPAPGRA